MKTILGFLSELRENNNREWFAANKERYVEANNIFNEFASQLLAEVQKFDPLTGNLSLKDCTYRIYRDTRFSTDKTPYKTHFGLYICPGGKKSGNAGYYFHVEPRGGGMIGDCLLDAGIFMPMPDVLRSVRDEVFDNGEQVMASLRSAGKHGFELDRSNSLIRTPKGFPAGTEWDEYLRLKDFHITKVVDEGYLFSKDLAKRAAEDFSKTYPFMSLVQRAAQFAHELSEQS